MSKDYLVPNTLSVATENRKQGYRLAQALVFADEPPIDLSFTREKVEPGIQSRRMKHLDAHKSAASEIEPAGIIH